MTMDRKAFDPEVYEFYKATIDGPGFSARISAEDIDRLRENEISGHAASLPEGQALSLFASGYMSRRR